MRSAFTALLLLLASAPSQARQPNVVFMLIDDMGWTDLGCYGSKYYESPNIDKLATEGMRFTQAHSACTVCSPTRSAILTGKYPARTHITDWIAGHDRPFAKLKIPDWSMHLPLEEETIAKRFKSAGYSTASIGKWHLGGPEFWPEHQGFDLNVAGMDLGSPPSYFSPYKIKTLPDGPPGEFLPERLTAEAVKFVEANKDKPFFLYLPHYAVHTPINARKEVIAKYQAKRAAGGHSNPVYAGLVEAVDESVKVLRDKLEELGLTQDTIFIFTSDNGGLSQMVNGKGWSRGPTDNSPARLGKGSAFEGGTRIPLIIAWPGQIKAGTLCDEPVISCDHYSTLLELTGVSDASGHQADGLSMVPLLKQTGGFERDAIYWHYPHYHPGSATPYSAIMQGEWKLIEYFEDMRVELYNLRRDPGESGNVAGENADRTAAMTAKLHAWRESVGAQVPTPNPAYDPEKAWMGKGEEGDPAKKRKGKSR
ncbi:MAG: N-acetylgalactosamine 6-sulfate sulfatase [Verrucomicrobiaceae bacterium]|nr:N-acetylgalactosamine 6-sulfate sulfatase [Verrucomicrobiaceae bacterium]